MRNVYMCCIIVLSVFTLGMQGTVNTQQNTVIVPNVKGITLEVATKILQTAGLQAWFHGSSDLSAIVERQVPQPGLELSVGEAVILVADTRITPTANVLASGAQEQPPAVFSQPAIPTGSVSTLSGTRTAMRSKLATNVSVSPSQSTWQTSQVLAYPAKDPEGKSTIFYQPPQQAISHYFVADTQPRFYPAWYPKRFLTVVSPQGSASTAQSEEMKIAGQSQVQPQGVDQTTTGQSHLARYPKVFVSQESAQESSVLQTDTQQRVGVFSVSTTPAVPVPNLLRLRQEDAAAAIKKAGLTVGKISRMPSSQVRPGLVIQQTPRARALVPAGTQVYLWIAE